MSELPTGLKFAQDKKTKAWSVAGVPTKVESKLVTFTTVANGSTVVERRAFEVRANAYAGTYCLVQEKTYEVASLSAVLTVAAGGTAKLIFTENARKWTVTAKSIAQGDVIGFGFTLPADAKAGLEERQLSVDLDGQELRLGGTVKLGDLYVPGKLPESVTEDYVVTASVAYDSDGAGTAGCLYLSATVSKKTGIVAVTGKLADGAAVKGTTYFIGLEAKEGEPVFAPVLVTDKQKRTLSIMLCYETDYIVRVDGRAATIPDPAYGEFLASQLKNKKASDLAPTANCVQIGVQGATPVEFPPTAKQLATKLGTGGVLKLTQKDADGVTWTLEMVPCAGSGGIFVGIATGKKGKESYIGQSMLYYKE